MKESAQIALSFLRSHGAELELPVGDLKDRGAHIHFPAGAVPKDGPSAGVTMTTALASLLSGQLSPGGQERVGRVRRPAVPGTPAGSPTGTRAR
ncbi:Lon protease [Streptomyces violaceorubidus]